MTSSKDNDPVNHPKHYTSSEAKCSKCSNPIECIDISQHYNFPLGSVFKYLWRKDLKGSALEDLKKAAWYLNKEIERLSAKDEGEWLDHVLPSRQGAIMKFVQINSKTGARREIYGQHHDLPK